MKIIVALKAFLHSRNFILWIGAVLLAALTVMLVQFPLCDIAKVSMYFENLSAARAMQVLSIIFVVPSYLLLGFMIQGRKAKWINLAAFTALLIVYLPLLWILGFYTSRLFFSECTI